MNFNLFSEKYVILSENVFLTVFPQNEEYWAKSKKMRKFLFFYVKKKLTNFPQNTTKCRIYETKYFAQYMPHFFKKSMFTKHVPRKFVKNLDDLWEVCQKFDKHLRDHFF